MDLNVSGLRTFYRGNKLKRYALSVIASQLSEGEINDLAKIFLNLDKDGDGLLSYDELMSGLKNYTANCDDLIKIYQQEFEKDKKINYNEFIASTMELQFLYNKEEKLKSAFKVFDKNGDGKITEKELEEVLGQHEGYKDKPKEFWTNLIAESDKNGDGEIDYDEFVTMIMGKTLLEG